MKPRRAGYGWASGWDRWATRRMGLAPERPLAAVRDAITIVRGMLAGEEVSCTAARVGVNVTQEEKALAAHAALTAARGDQALALSGEIADGPMI